MKKQLILITILMLVVCLLSADAIAMLSANKGKVTLVRDKSQIKFQKGQLLMNNDVIRTGEESFAAYKYVDASSSVKMFSNSVATISATKDGKGLSKKVTVSKGSILSTVKKGSGVFQVSTPSTVASVKGTDFLTKVEDDGSSMFIVNDGEVELRMSSTGEVTSVGKGKTARVQSSGRVEVRDSRPEDLSPAERQEIESEDNNDSNTIRIPVLDKNGNLKQIEITF